MKTISYNPETHRLVPVSALTPLAVPPFYPDEPRQEQLNNYHSIKGWNDCLALLSAAPVFDGVDDNLQPEPVELRETQLVEVEPVEIIWPEYHYMAMGCGLEDRGITDRYEAMQHGWECALERVAECLPEAIYTAPPSCDACKSNKQDYAALKQQLEEIKRQRDELAKALENLIDIAKMYIKPAFVTAAESALASVKTNAGSSDEQGGAA